MRRCFRKQVFAISANSRTMLETSTLLNATTAYTVLEG
jgi:hypothetical protein